MSRSRRAILAAVAAAWLAGACAAAERVKPPEFESGHQLPGTSAPWARAAWQDWLDVPLLLTALAGASYLALKRRSRAGVFAVMLLSLAYFGFWRGGCVCAIGAIQHVSQGLAQPSYAVPLVVLAFLLVPIVLTLFAGRTFCGAVCPLGAIQDLVALRPMRVPGWLEHSLGLLPYVYLGAAVLFAATGSAYVICRYDPLVGVFRLVPLGKWGQALARADLPGGAAGIAQRPELLLLTGAVLVICVFVGRAYCRFACPLGAIFRLCSPLARRHVTIAPKECIQCRLCEDACPFGAISRPQAQARRGDLGKGRRRLALAIALLPVLVALGGLVGWSVHRPASRMHFTVRLADQVRLEETGQVLDRSDASEAFRNTGQPMEELYEQALAIERKFAVGLWLVGGFTGLAFGGKLVRLSIRRGPKDYQPDKARCFSCGRCFASCPLELERRKEMKAARPSGRKWCGRE